MKLTILFSIVAVYMCIINVISSDENQEAKIFSDIYESTLNEKESLKKEYNEAESKDKVIEQIGKHIYALRLVSVNSFTPEMKKLKILCWVNTYEKNHQTRVQAIKDTWGKKCSRLLFFSNVEDLSIPTIKVVAPATHEELWKKHRQVLKIIYEEYQEGDYDWVYKCDDDTFLIMENLKNYVLSSEIQQDKDKPLLLGHRMTLPWWEMQRPFEPLDEHDPLHVKHVKQIREENPRGLIYTPGGGGYAFNWKYLETITKALDTSHCLKNEIIPDDWAISFCMYFYQIIPKDTRDHLKRERFHQYSPQRVYFESHDDQKYDHKIYPNIYYENNWFSDHHGIGWQNGTNCCAPDSISFHYMKPDLMYATYEYFYPQTSKYRKKNL